MLGNKVKVRDLYRLNRLSTLAGLFLAFLLLASPQAAGRSPSEFRTYVETLLDESRVPADELGIEVISLEPGKTLFARSPRVPFTIASNNKIITTAAALYFLGPDHSFRTEIYLEAKPDRKGISRGNLILRGGGDPNISGRFTGGDPLLPMKAIADELKQRGLKRLLGSIVADDTFFDREHIHPRWDEDQIANWYSAGVSALSYNDNCIDITIRPTSPGEQVTVSLSPPTSYVTLLNECRTTSSRKRHRFSFRREAGSNTILLKGEYYARFGTTRHHITVDDPALYFATVLSEVLEDEGIEVEGEVRRILSEESLPKAPPVIVITSKLREAIRVANKRSQNFYAEQILKLLGAVRKRDGSFYAGAKVVEEFLSAVGIPPGEYSYVDGSGLSRDNRFTPSQITKVLAFMHSHHCGQDFLDSLSVAGFDGSLRRRWKKTKLAGNVLAKTGSMRYVHTLSGYVQNSKGERFAFSILYNNRSRKNALDIRRLEEKILLSLYETEAR